MTMNKKMGRKAMSSKNIVGYAKAALLSVGAAALLSACYTAEDGRKGLSLPGISDLAQLLGGPTAEEKEAKARKLALRSLHLTDPAREDDLNEVWKDIVVWTDARLLSDSRLSIRSKGRFFGSKRHSETNFFIRAAAETMRNDYDGFVIVHMDYFGVAPKIFSLTPDISLGGRRWIGNYENFRENMNEQNLFDNPEKAGRKTMDGVILMMNKEDFPNRDRFNANEIYLNYLTYEQP